MLIKKFLPTLVFVAALLLQSCASVFNFMDPNGPVYLGSYAHVLQADTAEIKVVSYNIAWAKKVNLATQELLQFPEIRGADIIFLQEIGMASVDHMAKALGYNYIYRPVSNYQYFSCSYGKRNYYFKNR